MKVKVQLYGVLGKKFPDFNYQEGADVELPEEATVMDLLKHLEIPESWGVAVAMDSRILKYGEHLRDGAGIRVFQTIHGG